jgi:cell fate (sporulation/competence/biofilm development) regulator YlbF (YheA/YmcA/DUF963 family)
MNIIEKLKKLYDFVWMEDIQNPTIPEYIELHEKMQKILKEIEKIIKESEEEK